MFARVIVGINTSELDRVFDYEIGEEWLGTCKKGVRVIVPFGYRNKKTEGYVLDVSKEVSGGYNGNFKSIIEVLDGGNIMFTDTTLFLAEFMQKKYFCTLSNCLQTVMPSAFKVRTIVYIGLKNEENIENIENIEENIEENKINKLNDEQKEVYDYLLLLKTASVNNVVKYFSEELKKEFNTLNILKELKKLNIIYTYEKVWSGQYKNEKTYYSINKNTDIYIKAFEKIKNDNRKIKQLEVFEIFNEFEKKVKEVKEVNEEKEVKEENIISLKILKERNISLSSIKTLEKAGILNKLKIEERRSVFAESDYKKTTAFNPNDEQKNALDIIYNSMDYFREYEKRPILLHGITGSGKTEIYLQTIEKNIKDGKQAIVLVPEIALTPQIMNQFISRFGDKVAVTHSRLSDGERVDQWRKARDGEVSIMIGPRSALFTPFSNLGVIIIDEVHETTYISDTTPKYDAREVAVALSRKTKALLIMGSATPNVELYYKGLQGEFNIVELKKRAGGGELPEIKLIDMRFELANGNRSPFSVELQMAIRENLTKGEQSMLFLNRRGYATFVSCRSCGLVMECSDCELPYTYHTKEDELMCHRCGKKEDTPKICPACQSKYIRFFGTGTQKIEEEAKRLFPKARILRMDFDTTKGKFGFQHILESFKNGEGDILIGTQMIAKGHDFPKVTLMGIMAADTSLYTASFYGGENTFQLITQGAGRAGRAKALGRVYLQTYQPKHYSIKHGKNQDYKGFYKEEIMLRKFMKYPPFGIFFSVVLLGKDDDLVSKLANKLADKMRNNNEKKLVIMGAVPTTQRKIDGNYGYRILLQGSNEEELIEFATKHIDEVKIKYKKYIKNDIYFNLTLNPRYIV